MPRFIPILVGCLFLTWPSHGQQTRHELLRLRREENRARVAPYLPNPVEKRLLSMVRIHTHVQRKTVDVFLRATPDGYEVVGIEREI